MIIRVSRRKRVFGGLLALTLLAVLIGFGTVLRPDQYQALSGGIQAFGVLLALAIAAATLVSDSHDRRVDRVLQLHEMFTTPQMEAIRDRLRDHFRNHSDGTSRLRAVSLDELDSKGNLAKYSDDDSTHSPYKDIRLLLRFMERASAARASHTVDEALFHELIGRHAAWWAVAVGKDPAASPHLLNPLLDLAAWADEYHKRHSSSTKYYMQSWGKGRQQDFGKTTWH
jgi:hypothetical protein